MADTKKIYEVEKGRIISSNHYGRNFKEGEVIDLSFASDEDIALLIASGAVKPSKKQSMPAEEKPEVTNG